MATAAEDGDVALSSGSEGSLLRENVSYLLPTKSTGTVIQPVPPPNITLNIPVHRSPPEAGDVTVDSSVVVAVPVAVVTVVLFLTVSLVFLYRRRRHSRSFKPSNRDDAEAVVPLTCSSDKKAMTEDISTKCTTETKGDSFNNNQDLESNNIAPDTVPNSSTSFAELYETAPHTRCQLRDNDDFTYEDAFLDASPNDGLIQPPVNTPAVTSGFTMVDNSLYDTVSQQDGCNKNDNEDTYSSEVIINTDEADAGYELACGVKETADSAEKSTSHSSQLNGASSSCLPHDYDPVYVPRSDASAMGRRLDHAGYVRSSRMRLSVDSHAYEELPMVNTLLSTPPLPTPSPTLPRRNLIPAMATYNAASPQLPERNPVSSMCHASPRLPKRNPPLAVFTRTEDDDTSQSKVRRAWDSPTPTPSPVSLALKESHVSGECLDVSVPLWDHNTDDVDDVAADGSHVYSSVSDAEADEAEDTAAGNMPDTADRLYETVDEDTKDSVYEEVDF